MKLITHTACYIFDGNYSFQTVIAPHASEIGSGDFGKTFGRPRDRMIEDFRREWDLSNILVAVASTFDEMLERLERILERLSQQVLCLEFVNIAFDEDSGNEILNSFLPFSEQQRELVRALMERFE